MPGVYHEEPSLAHVDASLDYDANQYDRSKDTSQCKDMYQDIYDPIASGLAGNVRSDPVWVPTYEHHRSCPNHQNLIAIVGDDPADPDRVCDDNATSRSRARGARAPTSSSPAQRRAS